MQGTNCFECPAACDGCVAPDERLCIECKESSFYISTDNLGNKWCTNSCPAGKFEN